MKSSDVSIWRPRNQALQCTLTQFDIKNSKGYVRVSKICCRSDRSIRAAAGVDNVRCLGQR